MNPLVASPSRRPATCGQVGTLRRVQPDDLAIRNTTYQQITVEGRVPTSAEVAAALGMPVDELRASWQRLQLDHALVLDADTGEIRMANPFSGVATPFVVHAAGRTWYANCAWDAFGICAALDVDGRIETVCPDCDEALTSLVRDRSPDASTLLFHCLVPAAAWWDDIAFT